MEIENGNEKKKIRFTEDIKQPMETSMMYTINYFFCSWRTHESEPPVHCVTSWMTIPVYLTSSTSASQFKEAPETCQLWKKLSFVSMSDKLIELNGSCEVLTQGRWNLFSLICKLLQDRKISNNHQNNVMVMSTDGDIIYFYQMKTYDGCVARVKFLQEKETKGYNHLLPLMRKISTTSMLNLVAHPSQLPMPPLRPCVTFHVKIVPCRAKGCCLIKNFEREDFLWHKLSLNSHLWR